MIDRLIPPWIREDPDQHRQARMAVVIVLGLELIGVMFLLHELILPFPRAHVPLLVGMTAAAIPIGTLWLRASMQVSAWSMSLLLLGLLLFLSMLPDGSHLWSIAWCAATPLIAVSVGGWRTGVQVAVLAAVVQTAGLWVHHSEVPSPVDGPGRFPIDVLDAIALTGIVAVTAVVFDRSRERLMRRADETHRALAEEVHRHAVTRDELERTHDHVVEHARLAGRAEIASGVLHNVGNALNSMRTSATLVRGGLSQRSDEQALTRLSGLFAQRVAACDVNDEKLVRVPQFLERLYETRRNRAAQLLAEVDRLQQQVDHVAAIIAVQQRHAKTDARPMLDHVPVRQALEDAALVACADAGRIVVRVECDDAAITTDRHQLVLIVTHLLTNAREEVLSGSSGPPRIEVSASRLDDTVRIEVADSGRGVPEEARTSIFRHGFTTKDGGHGFGLHVSALAARTLGGSLFLADKGPLPGACFVLELPANARAPEGRPVRRTASG